MLLPSQEPTHYSCQRQKDVVLLFNSKHVNTKEEADDSTQKHYMSLSDPTPKFKGVRI